jgi:hypothetical protein
MPDVGQRSTLYHLQDRLITENRGPTNLNAQKPQKQDRWLEMGLENTKMKNKKGLKKCPKPLILLWRGRRDANSRPSRMAMRDVLARTELSLKVF